MYVGIAKDEPIGLWLCPTCRKVTSDLQNQMTSFKDDVQDLKQSIQLVITAINQISLKLQNGKLIVYMTNLLLYASKYS